VYIVHVSDDATGNRKLYREKVTLVSLSHRTDDHLGLDSE